MGSPGQPGPVGAFGAPGPYGFGGLTGSTGQVGTSGMLGLKGLPGIVGNPGATGAFGSTGGTGATGPPGYTGSTGYTGLPGFTGSTGFIGPTGSSYYGRRRRRDDESRTEHVFKYKETEFRPRDEVRSRRNIDGISKPSTVVINNFSYDLHFPGSSCSVTCASNFSKTVQTEIDLLQNQLDAEAELVFQLTTARQELMELFLQLQQSYNRVVVRVVNGEYINLKYDSLQKKIPGRVEFFIIIITTFACPIRRFPEHGLAVESNKIHSKIQYE